MSDHRPHIPRLLSEVEELFPVPTAGVVRLPELVGVPFTDRVKAIVDHPHFQRLRTVRQLSLAYLVFPGAVHTRFEHSLGVFETTLRYLRALLSSHSQSSVLDEITRGDVESLLLAALLHDIGHYPFNHLLEDLYGDIADHIDLVRPFLTGEIGQNYPSLQLPPGTPSLGELIHQHWPHASFDDICYFVSGSTGREGSEVPASNVKRLLRSILDGPVDADKMDYLYRDSIHCGVPYGRFIDRDRFFQSLIVMPERPDTLALKEKGRICVELFAYARSAMYSEVYWHHASRSTTAMLNRAFREVVADDPRFGREQMMDLVFGRSDEELVSWLASHGGEICSELMSLIHRRRPYKRLLVIEHPAYPSLFDLLDRAKWDKRYDFDRLQQLFVERINAKGLFADFLGRELRSHDILVDVPRRRGGLPDVPILGEHSERALDSEATVQQGVWAGIKHDFERWVRKIRVFCHPDIQAALLKHTGSKKLEESKGELLANLLTSSAWEEIQLRD